MHLVLQQNKAPEPKSISDPIQLFDSIYVLAPKPNLLKDEVQETLHGHMVPELWKKRMIYKTELWGGQCCEVDTILIIVTSPSPQIWEFSVPFCPPKFGINGEIRHRRWADADHNAIHITDKAD